MHTASPFLAAEEPTTDVGASRRPADEEIWDFAELCLEETASAVHEARAASTSELNRAVATTRESHAEGNPADLLEALARIQGNDEEHLGPAIVELGNKVASTMTPYPALIPFGGKLIAPSAFYDSFDRLHKIARVLLSPVIYAEDTDAIGTASINPVASTILSMEIQSSVFKRFGIRPFLTVARLDYESWSFLSRKHFEL